MKLDQITTLKELDKQDWCDLLPHAHIIVGDGGRCMCGIYDGEALSCPEIINRLRSAECTAPNAKLLLEAMNRPAQNDKAPSAGTALEAYKHALTAEEAAVWNRAVLETVRFMGKATPSRDGKCRTRQGGRKALPRAGQKGHRMKAKRKCSTKLADIHLRTLTADDLI